MSTQRDLYQVASHTPSALAQRVIIDLPSPYNLHAYAPIHGLARNPSLHPFIWDEVYNDEKSQEYGSMKYLLHSAPDDARALLVGEAFAPTRWDALEMGLPNLSPAGWEKFISQEVFTKRGFDTFNATSSIISGNLDPALALSLWARIQEDTSEKSLYIHNPKCYAEVFASLAMKYNLLTDQEVTNELLTRPPFEQLHGEFLAPQTAQMLNKRPGVLPLLAGSAKAALFTRNLAEFNQAPIKPTPEEQLSAQYIVGELTPILDALGPKAWELYLKLLPNWAPTHQALLERVSTITPILDALGPEAWVIYLQLLPSWQEGSDTLLEAVKALAA